MPDSVLALQRCLVDLALEPFEPDPEACAAAHGLPERDQAALGRFRERLLYYREAVRDDIFEPISLDFPLTQALLERAGAWEACRAAFLVTRSLSSPFYRDIAPTFLGWLASSGWGQERWPFLVQLAHFELMKELVEHVPDGPRPADLHPGPAPGDLLVLAPPTQVLTYGFLVHEATWERPEPAPGPCQLLASRGADGYLQWRELTAPTACLLVRAQTDPIGEAARALGLDDLPEVLAFLGELATSGVLWGFREG